MPRSRRPTAPSGSRTARAARVRVRTAGTPRAVAEVRRLVAEYVRGLDIDLGFQGIDRELERFPEAYSGPGGRLLLAEVDGRPAGCVAIRRLRGSTCEMKRLYVRPAYRGRGVGQALAVASLREAREAGYRRMRLDTLGRMRSAMRLYTALGFREIPAYRFNPEPTARYFEIELRATSGPLRRRRRVGGTASTPPRRRSPRAPRSADLDRSVHDVDGVRPAA